MKVLGYIFVASLCFASSFTQDDMRKPPSITKGPETKVIFRENDAITLTCKAEGIPAVTYVWKKNREELNLNLSNIHRGSDGDITIVEATRNDNGLYQCFATNQYGTALSTMANIIMAFLERTSHSNIVNMIVLEGHPFVIRAPQRNSFPPPTYNWEITTGMVDTSPRTYGQSQRVRSANNGDLHFAYALKEDELGGSIYKNTAFNPNIDVRSGGTYTRVMVTQGSGPPPDFPPSITYFKSQEVAVIGGSIELECFFSGKPLPEITWSGPRNSLPSGRSSISQYETHLMISNLVESDEGDYVCIANNTLGTINNTFNTRVEAKPVFKKEYDGPRNVNVTEGEFVTFNCSAFANPEATVVWLRNGQPIDVNNVSQRFAFSNDNKSLTIRDVCRDCDDREKPTDLSVIQCIASNAHGYVFASGYLNVLLKTNVWIRGPKKVSVDFLEEKNFTFQCYATSDPSTPPTVRWYKTEPFDELVRDEPPYVNVTNEFLIIWVYPNCSAECVKYLGEYRCIGDNGYSRDNPTITLSYQHRPPPVKTKVTIKGLKHATVDFLEEKQFVFQCIVTSDPSTPPTARWYKTEPHGELVRSDPPYVNVTNGFLIITIYPNCSPECAKYLGEYRCIGDNGYSRENHTITLSYQYRPPPAEISNEGATSVALWVVLVSIPTIVVLALPVRLVYGLWRRQLNKNRVVITQDPTVYVNTSVSLNESVADDNINLKPVGPTVSQSIANTNEP